MSIKVETKTYNNGNNFWFNVGDKVWFCWMDRPRCDKIVKIIDDPNMGKIALFTWLPNDKNDNTDLTAVTLDHIWPTKEECVKDIKRIKEDRACAEAKKKEEHKQSIKNTKDLVKFYVEILDGRRFGFSYNDEIAIEAARERAKELLKI